VLTEVLVGVTRPGSVARKILVHHVRVGRICALGACWRGRRCRRRRTAHVAVVSRSIGKARPLAELLLRPVSVVLTELGVRVGPSVAGKVLGHHPLVPLICAISARGWSFCRTALVAVVARSIGKARPLTKLLLCPVSVVLTEVLVGVTRPGSVARKILVHHVRVGRICALGACWRGRRCRRRRTAHVAVVSRSIGKARPLAELLLRPVSVVLTELGVRVGPSVAGKVLGHHPLVPLICAISARRRRWRRRARRALEVVAHLHRRVGRIVPAVIVSIEAIARPTSLKSDGLAVGHLGAPGAAGLDRAALLRVVAIRVGPKRGASQARIRPAAERRPPRPCHLHLHVLERLPPSIISL